MTGDKKPAHQIRHLRVFSIRSGNGLDVFRDRATGKGVLHRLARIVPLSLILTPKALPKWNHLAEGQRGSVAARDISSFRAQLRRVFRLASPFFAPRSGYFRAA